MPTEFITLDGRLTIKFAAVIEKKLKQNKEGFMRFAAFTLWVALLAFCVYRVVEERDYFFILQGVVTLFWMEPGIKSIYASLFVETWKSTIPFADIQSVNSAPLDNSLETQVTLHLKNGRKKFYVFRNAEKQADDFIQAVELQLHGALSFS